MPGWRDILKSGCTILGDTLYLLQRLSNFFSLPFLFISSDSCLGGKLVVSTFFREIHAKYPSQLAEVVSGLPQDLQETLTVAIHGAPNEPTPATNVAPLVPPSVTTTTTDATAPAPGMPSNNDGDLSPSDNGEPVEAT